MKTFFICLMSLAVIPFGNSTPAPNLGLCDSFALHGHAGVAANGDESIIYGDIGGDNAITGFGPEPLPRVSDESLYGYYSVTSKSNDCARDKLIAYNQAMGTICTNNTVPTDLSGVTLFPGVYCNSAGFFQITSGELVLDGLNNNGSVFILQTATHVHTSINTNILLINGAQAKNVFWVAGSSIDLSGYSTFRGNLLAYSSITMGTGTVLSGRALTRVASVTLAGKNSISKPELIVNGGSDI
jgi:hypothetical protein